MSEVAGPPLRVYICGKITGDPDFKKKFYLAEYNFTSLGFVVLNPASLPAGLEYEDYMEICLSMVTVCDILYLLPDWETSPGARRERTRALRLGKRILGPGKSALV